jgi:hypothetical protein
MRGNLLLGEGYYLGLWKVMMVMMVMAAAVAVVIVIQVL